MPLTVSPNVPAYDELMWPVLKALSATGDSASNDELLAKIIEAEGFPESVQTLMHTDKRITKLAYNLAWQEATLSGLARSRTAIAVSGP